MKINKIIIAVNEKIFLSFAKKLNFKDIKVNEEIIFSEKPYLSSSREEFDEEENIVLIYGKNIFEVIDFIKNKYIVIEKIILVNSGEVLSNGELKQGDVIIPNSFIHPQSLLDNKEEVIFLDNTSIGKDYDMKKFGLMLSGICSEKNNNLENNEKLNEFEADVKSEKIFSYLKELKSQNLLDKTTVVLEITQNDDYENLVSIVDMML